MDRKGTRTPTQDRADDLEAELREKRRELETLTAVRDELLNIYVFSDDDPEARAFDEFYGAYDEVHARVRRFLLD